MEFEIIDENLMRPRDWFAAFAMQALIAKRLNSHSMDADSEFVELTTYDAFCFADAMMDLRD
jgi:hypothetical protein